MESTVITSVTTNNEQQTLWLSRIFFSLFYNCLFESYNIYISKGREFIKTHQEKMVEKINHKVRSWEKENLQSFSAEDFTALFLECVFKYTQC